jgi:hypothetical protein
MSDRLSVGEFITLDQQAQDHVLAWARGTRAGAETSRGCAGGLWE